MQQLAYFYQTGKKVEQNLDKAVELYQRAIDLGNTSSMTSMGYLYQRGTGVEKDINKAIEYFEMAANKGNGAGYHALGLIYQHGNDGIEANMQKVRFFFILNSQY